MLTIQMVVHFISKLIYTPIKFCCPLRPFSLDDWCSYSFVAEILFCVVFTIYCWNIGYVFFDLLLQCLSDLFPELKHHKGCMREIVADEEASFGRSYLR